MDPPASGDDRPVKGALDGGRVQHVAGGGDEQRRVRLSPGSPTPAGVREGGRGGASVREPESPSGVPDHPDWPRTFTAAIRKYQLAVRLMLPVVYVVTEPTVVLVTPVAKVESRLRWMT